MMKKSVPPWLFPIQYIETMFGWEIFLSTLDSLARAMAPSLRPDFERLRRNFLTTYLIDCEFLFEIEDSFFVHPLLSPSLISRNSNTSLKHPLPKIWPVETSSCLSKSVF